jgi:Family of unknown function (DUF6011)
VTDTELPGVATDNENENENEDDNDIPDQTTDIEIDQIDFDQILAEASPQQREAAEKYADEHLEDEGETRTWERIVADHIIHLDEQEGIAEVRRRLAGQSKQIDTEQKIEAQRAHAERQDQYPEWWDEYRQEVTAGRLKTTQTAKILFFLTKGMLVKDVAKMLSIRYQIVYQVASWNELAGPKEGQVTCQVCGRPLTQPNSTTRKIGPICAKGGKH